MDQVVEQGRLDLLQHFIGPNTVNLQDLDGNTALILACKAGRYDMVKFLLEQGADRHLSNHAGETAQSIVLNERKTLLIKLLYIL